jgi:gliotoxin/aspirochlorine biosynthesis aminotransferase
LLRLLTKGIFKGCVITQANPEMQVGLALASNTTTSSLSSIFVSSLLTSPKLPEILKLNSQRLGEAYASLTQLLRKYHVPYIPACQGLYVLAKIVPAAADWQEEAAAIAKFKDAGVLISSGKSFHGPDSEKGWARIGFAVEAEMMKEALQRIEKCLSSKQEVEP